MDLCRIHGSAPFSLVGWWQRVKMAHDGVGPHYAERLYQSRIFGTVWVRFAWQEAQDSRLPQAPE
jgi:hypothetical protein